MDLRTTNLTDVPIIIDNYCPDGIAALFGPELKNNSASPIFKREFALMDLVTANIVGNCRTVINIKVKDQKNKAQLVEILGVLCG